MCERAGCRMCESRGVPLPLLHGPRLELKRASLWNADLNSDAEVMEHISGQPASRSETEEEWTQRMGPRSAPDQGLGYWVGYVNAQPIGWWGLGFTASEPRAGELGSVSSASTGVEGSARRVPAR
jgi:hypothetical protein